MTKFLFAYHGGGEPSSQEEGEAVMKQWMDWLGGLGDSVVQMGDPVGKSWTVTGDKITQDGGSNPISGYTIIQAASIEEACEISKGCPIHGSGGSVEVAPIMEM